MEKPEPICNVKLFSAGTPAASTTRIVNDVEPA
jgi:hypothetical protein